MKINGKIWNSSDDINDDINKEMGTDDHVFITEMYRLINLLHYEINWSNLKTDEETDQCLQHFQSCTSQVRHFYNDANEWLQREGGAHLIILTPAEQRKALFEYATLIDHPVKKYLTPEAGEDEWWDAIR